MTAKDLENIFNKNDWSGDEYTPDKQGRYVPPVKIRYALVASLNDDRLTDDTHYSVPYWMRGLAVYQAKAAEKMAHQYDAVKRNQPLGKVLQDFNTKGKKTIARAELRRRVPYAPFAEQQKVLCTFMDGIAVDRRFALNYLDAHWDDCYTPYVEKAWSQFHEKESARVIVHHFPQEFIIANQDRLAIVYNYLQVRLRMPADAPVDREQLSGSAYLYLCARQSLPVTDPEAENIFYQNMLDALATYAIRNRWRFGSRPVEERSADQSLCSIPPIGSTVWSLGMLGKTDILLRFVFFEKDVLPLVMDNKWQQVRDAFSALDLPLDFASFDYELTSLTQNRQTHTFEMPDSSMMPDNAGDDFPYAPF